MAESVLAAPSSSKVVALVVAIVSLPRGVVIVMVVPLTLATCPPGPRWLFALFCAASWALIACVTGVLFDAAYVVAPLARANASAATPMNCRRFMIELPFILTLIV